MTNRAAPGTIIGGRYELRIAVGHGGMGTVWRGMDTILKREVAVKEVILPPGLAVSDRDSMYERTLREARAAASLSHPSVVQVFDVVTDDERPWIVMELLEARSLADMVLEDGPLAPRSVAKIGIALLGALEVAHAAGVLHRDVKPANVLITSDGRCVLTDFGVAKLPADVQLTTPGMVLGSPHFISPERALGRAFGPPSDIFSLGVTLYTAVEGRPPFDKGDPLATMHSVVEDPPAPPVRCGPLLDVLYGLMEKDPTARWNGTTARTVLRELLAGPLAQNAHAQHVTDPFVVVSRQSTEVAPPPQPVAVPAAITPKQVGGRAMLQTGETPLAKGRGGRHAAEKTTMLPTLSTNAATGSFKAIPKRLGYAIGAGVLAVVLVATVAWAVLDNDEEPPPITQPPASTTSPTAGGPTKNTQTVTFKGISVEIPLGWKAAPGGSYMDYRDPKDPDRWIRLNVTAEKDAHKALESADRRHTFCKVNYQQIGLTDSQLAGAVAADLEYVCLPKDKQPKHALWRIGIVNGKACHVYLSTWDNTWAADKAIFDTAVSTFAYA